MPAFYGLRAAPNPQDRISFCGPTAIAAITGRSVGEVEDAVLAYRVAHTPLKRKPRKRNARVVTMWWTEVEPVLRALGWRVLAEQQYGFTLPITFARWQRATAGGGPYIILLTGHFVAVSGHWFVDTRNREPIPLSRAPYRKSRVRYVARLAPQED